MAIEKSKSAEAQMLIRKPASQVFEAFIDPEITKHFWFTKGSGRLEVGKKITWEWEMYGFSTPVVATEIIQDKKISIEWGEPATKVDFNFEPMHDGASTFVTIANYGFNKSGVTEQSEGYERGGACRSSSDEVLWCRRSRIPQADLPRWSTG